jgi:probable F420-dependent oxidoreductase
MRVYTILPQQHWRDVAAAARDAEAAGFDAVMTVELGHDPLAPLAFAALETNRVELTPSVTVAFPRSPTTLAQQAWDIHANSGGRFVLGLGSQVKGHNERRFGIPWTAPAPRMRDYVQALRAVWTAWETRGRLNFDSPHYKLTLMTPDFSPEPTGLPMVPVTVAAVGEAMLRVAGQVGDGVRLHPLCSRAYLQQVCMPQMMEGMRRGGRSRLNFDVHGGGFVCTGPDDATVALEMEKARRRIGFYGSTRTYLPILALHGLEDLSAKLHRMSVEGKWDRMGAEVSDDTVRIFAACGTYDHLAKAIDERFGGAADSIDLHFPHGTPVGLMKELVTEIHRIPHTFSGFNTNW